ncbi:MAG: ABC transporter ATP-binding protein [Chloroflexi bacterium]|nr:ABC transporter ATP-binding protein [Chloroflexota bacterium]
MALLEAQNIGQTYDGKAVLQDISLSIGSGEVFALIGPTGAGKTTLLRLLDFLETPSTGAILFDGTDITRSNKLRLGARRRMSFVQQKPVSFSMNVFDNVACGLRWRRQKSSAVRSKVETALELVGMADYRNRDARTLSGGETQRVAIARALVTQPEVLFLDEPTANLDPVSAGKVEETLAHVIQEHRTTVVMATHDMTQGQRLAGRIGVLIDGILQQTGSPTEIFCAPQSKEVAEFVGVENILSGIIAAKDDTLATVEVNGRAIQAISDFATGDTVYVLIRPEDIIFTMTKDSSSARNVFEGEILRMNTVGPLVRIEVDCGFPLLGVVTRQAAEELGIVFGKKIFASFKATALHTIRRWT